MKGFLPFLFVCSIAISVLGQETLNRKHNIFFEVLETGCQAKGHIEMINLDGTPFTLHLNNKNHIVPISEDASYILDTDNLTSGSVVYALNDTLKFDFEIKNCDNGNELYRIEDKKFELTNKLFRKELYEMIPHVLELFEEHQIEKRPVSESLNFEVLLPRNAKLIKAKSTLRKGITVDEKKNTVTFDGTIEQGEHFEYDIKFELTKVRKKEIPLQIKKPITSIEIWDDVKEDKDIIDLHINGERVLTHYTAMNAVEKVPIPVERIETIKVVNVSEGGIPPNTILLKISDGETEHTMNVITNEKTYTELVIQY